MRTKLTSKPTSRRQRVLNGARPRVGRFYLTQLGAEQLRSLNTVKRGDSSRAGKTAKQLNGSHTRAKRG